MFETLSSIALILFFMTLSFLFSGSETAYTAISKAKLLQKIKKGNKKAINVQKLLEKKDTLIGSFLIGNNFVNTAASAVTTGLLLNIFGDVGLIYATVIVTILLVLFSEITPKTLALLYPEKVATQFVTFARIVALIFGGPSHLAKFIVHSTLNLFGFNTKDAPRLSAQDELRSTVDLLHFQGGVHKEDKDMLGGLLDLNELEISDLMVHRTRMQSIDVNLSTEQIIQTALSSPYTRIPLYDGTSENIIGILHAKDLLRAINAHNGNYDAINIKDIISPPWFVPDTTSILFQLKAFRKRKSHFALVVDEYGEVKGLITLEDIIEEIVGDIADEFDVVVSGIRTQPDGSVNIDGMLPIRDLNRTMDWHLPDENATTIAGLIINTSGIIPEVGQVFQFFGFRFEILRKTRNKIVSIKINKLSK